MTENVIPIFPCKEFSETLDFYAALGFDITYRQDAPYAYGAVGSGGVALHFAKLNMHGAKNAVCLVSVDDAAPYHQAFAASLRAASGKIPTAGFPRLTRFKTGQTRFHLFDPSGNLLIYVNRDEPEPDYTSYTPPASPLLAALENAVFIRDTYVNDKAAAKVLEKALAKQIDAVPLDCARVLAARLELAVALGELERVSEIRDELARLPITDAERAAYHDELTAADRLERWISGA